MKSGNRSGKPADNRRKSESGPLGEVLKRLKPSANLKHPDNGCKMKESGASSVSSREPFSRLLPVTEDCFSPPPPEDIMVEVPSSIEDQYFSPYTGPYEVSHLDHDDIVALANAIGMLPNSSSRPITTRDLAPRDSSLDQYDCEAESEEEVGKAEQDHDDPEKDQLSAHSIRYSKPQEVIKRGLAAQHLKLARAKLLANPANKAPIQTPMAFPTNPWLDGSNREDKVFEPREDPLGQLMDLLYGDKTWTGQRIVDDIKKKTRPTEAAVWQLMKEGDLDVGKGPRDPVNTVSRPLEQGSITANGEPGGSKKTDAEGTFWDEM